MALQVATTTGDDKVQDAKAEKDLMFEQRTSRNGHATVFHKEERSENEKREREIDMLINTKDVDDGGNR